MKVVCIKNQDGGSVPWTREGHYYNLEVGKIYEGEFLVDNRGSKLILIKELNYKFCTPWWFVTLEEWREKQLEQIL